MNGQAFAVSATSLTGQSLGKKRHGMAQAYTTRTRKLGMCVSIFLGVVFFFFGGQIVALYSGGDQSLVELGAVIMMFVAVVQPFQSSQLILAGALRGAGDTKVTAAITFITVLLVRPALAIFATMYWVWVWKAPGMLWLLTRSSGRCWFCSGTTPVPGNATPCKFSTEYFFPLPRHAPPAWQRTFLFHGEQNRESRIPGPWS